MFYLSVSQTVNEFYILTIKICMSKVIFIIMIIMYAFSFTRLPKLKNFEVSQLFLKFLFFKPQGFSVNEHWKETDMKRMEKEDSRVCNSSLHKMFSICCL